MADGKYHIGIDARMYSTLFTGIGRYVHELTDRLFALRKDWKFTVFLSKKTFESFIPPGPHVEKELAPESHYSLAEQTSFLKRISKHNFDLFHFPHFNAPIFYRKKSIVTIHDLTISYYPGKKKTSWFHKIGYRLVLSSIVKHAERIITVSSHTKDDLTKMLRVSPDKITVIWNGLGKEFFRENCKTEEMEKVKKDLFMRHHIENPYFLYTGVHREHKNIVGMITAFQKLLSREPNAELIITGKEDPWYPEISGIIEREKLGDRVKRVGLVDNNELLALYYYARALVFPSFYEGFGFPPLEAMAMKIPVAASRSSSIPEICGDAVEYFDPKNTDDMAEKMLLVFSRDEMRKKLVEKGAERIRLFSWERMADETMRVYEEAISGKKS